MPRRKIPLISVIIPCYNYARYLPIAVESALSQQSSALNVEVIVVDDGSTDDTPRVAQQYGHRIRYMFQENQGLSSARNTGMRAAHGDFLLFLDADDLLSPGKSGKTFAAFCPPPGSGHQYMSVLVYCRPLCTACQRLSVAAHGAPSRPAPLPWQYFTGAYLSFAQNCCGNLWSF
ncbi:MAG: glycosyltransferase [Desulfovibrio sp.]|nr:glycosyltransferase [Desulfovibrio sp.]